MYNKDYFKQGILVQQELTKIYAEPGVRAKGKKFVYETFGSDWLGISEETFSDHCNREKYDFGSEQVPLHVEAMLRSIKRNREMARMYENKLIALSDIPYPEYKDLVDTIRSRQSKKAEEEIAREKVLREQD